MALQVTSEASELEDLEITLLLTAMATRYGFDFRNYALASLRRRVRHAVEQEGVANITQLQERVLRDPSCMERFIANLSVHVTTMFRDPQFFVAFREHVVPMLRTYPFIRVWHAGCSTGEEVYSLAILLEEEDLYERCRLYATDISDRLLRRAATGVFPLTDMREHTRNYQRAGGTHEFSRYYHAHEDHVIFAEALRRNMVFSQHNLVSDAAFNDFQVIMCRNVMIYFDATLQQRVHTLFYDSLCRFGVLGVGRKETIDLIAQRSCYREIGQDTRLYRKER
jgi:chemotaxis protein methyltransferase CheR